MSDSIEIEEEEKCDYCECEGEEMVSLVRILEYHPELSQILDHSTRQPAVLQHFELTQYSLNFLDSLRAITKPIVEVSLLPNIGVKGWCVFILWYMTVSSVWSGNTNLIFT